MLIACDGYWYNGKEQAVAEKLKGIEAVLKPEKTVIVPYLGCSDEVAAGLRTTPDERPAGLGAFQNAIGVAGDVPHHL